MKSSWGRKCEVCGEPAVYNVQKCAVRWRYDATGALHSETLDSDNEGVYVCEEHKDDY